MSCLQIDDIAMFDIRQFCAVAGQDCTQAFEDAIAAAAASATKRIVYVPVGVWLVDQIALKSNIHLVGSGWDSEIKQITNGSGPMVILEDANVEHIVIRDLNFNGNKAAQTSANAGIYLDNVGGSFSATDPHHRLENLIIHNCKGDGLWVTAEVEECIFKDIYCNANDLEGFNIHSYASKYIACTAGASGGHGFHVSSSNNKFVGCISYGNGQTASDGDGWFIDFDRNVFTACSAQDNKRHGWVVYNCKDIAIVGCESESNGTGTAAVGLQLDLCSYVVVRGFTAFDRQASVTQRYGYQISSTVTNSSIHGTSRNHLTGAVNFNAAADCGMDINNASGMQTIAYAASITPNPLEGGTISITLTGDITINAPASTNRYPGQRLSFLLTQDGVGSHTPTFDSIYRTQWTPAEVASETDAIHFLFDGTSYIEVGSATGIA